MEVPKAMSQAEILYPKSIIYECQISSDMFEGYRTLIRVEPPRSVGLKQIVIGRVVLELCRDLYKLGLKNLAKIASKTNFCIYSPLDDKKVNYICQCS